MSLAVFRRNLWRSVEKRPADWEGQLPGQIAFEATTEAHRYVAWFGANGTGKTRAQARQLLRVLAGKHPRFRPRSKRARRLKILICVTGWHSVSAADLAEQLHELEPPGLLGQQDIDDKGQPIGTSRDWYSPQRGFAGSPPRIVVLRGSMAGTIVDFTTLGAGSTHSAGGTYDLVIPVEPITPEVWAELVGRGRVVGGAIWYAFTPTMDSPPQIWVKESAEKGDLVLIRTELTPENLTLSTGRMIEPWDDVIARFALIGEEERDVRMGRSWKPLKGATYFGDVWHSDIIQRVPHKRLILIAGIDHSTRVGRTRIVVSGFSGDDRILRAHTLIDVRSESADPEVVAAVFLDALDSFGIRLEQIDYWIGDRVAMDRQLVRRDNMAFRAALLNVWHRRGGKGCPRPLDTDQFRQPKKRRGSHIYRLSYMRVMLAEKRWLIDPACELLPSDIQGFDGRDQAPEKDGLDAFGYSLELAGILTDLWLPPPS